IFFVRLIGVVAVGVWCTFFLTIARDICLYTIGDSTSGRVVSVDFGRKTERFRYVYSVHGKEFGGDQEVTSDEAERIALGMVVPIKTLMVAGHRFDCYAQSGGAYFRTNTPTFMGMLFFSVVVVAMIQAAWVL